MRMARECEAGAGRKLLGEANQAQTTRDSQQEKKIVCSPNIWSKLRTPRVVPRRRQSITLYPPELDLRTQPCRCIRPQNTNCHGHSNKGGDNRKGIERLVRCDVSSATAVGSWRQGTRKKTRYKNGKALPPIEACSAHERDKQIRVPHPLVPHPQLIIQSKPCTIFP